MAQGIDRRIDYNRIDNKIIDAMLELMATQSIDTITVKDITSKAGVGRGTFYLHFEDKYSVVEKLEERLFGELADINKHLSTFNFADHNEREPYPFFTETYEWVGKNRSFIAPLLSENGDFSFAFKWKQMIADYFKQLFKANGVSTRYTDLVYKAVSAGLMELIYYYVSSDNPISPQEMSRVSGRITHGIVEKFKK